MRRDYETVQLTRKGKRALVSGLIADPWLALIAEVAGCVDNVTPDHLEELCNEILDHYGDLDLALDAVKSGQVVFNKIELQ